MSGFDFDVRGIAEFLGVSTTRIYALGIKDSLPEQVTRHKLQAWRTSLLAGASERVARAKQIDALLTGKETGVASKTCLWTLAIEDDMDAWHGDCDIDFIIPDGTPFMNGMIYCPRCGRPIEEAT